MLGNGTTGSGTYATLPVAVTGLTSAVSVAIRSTPNTDVGNVCASRQNGTVWCWGERLLGNGTSHDSPVPVQVSGLSDALSVSGSSVLCARRADGTVECWGDATAYGLLGDGHRDPSSTPVVVDHIANFGQTAGAISLSTGTNSWETCAVLSDQTVECWGIVKAPGYPV